MAPGAGAVNADVGPMLSTWVVRAALWPVFRPTSVATARRTRLPSGTVVVSKVAWNGAEVSVANATQDAPTCRSNATEVVSPEDAALRAMVPATSAPGSESVTTGASLSTVTV